MHRQWIKSWRRKLDSSIWKMPPLYMRVFEWIIHSVNHEENSIPTPNGLLKILPGQRITSLRQIAEGVSYFEYGVERVPNTKTIKSILDWLESNGKCTVESNAKGTLITVINWDTYNSQDMEKVTQKEQKKVTQSKHGLDTNKNEKNEKNKNIYSDDFELFWKSYPKKVGKKAAWDQWQKYKPNLEKVLTALSWQIKTQKWKDGYILDPERYIKKHCWDDEPVTQLDLLSTANPMHVSDEHKRALERLRAEGYE